MINRLKNIIKNQYIYSIVTKILIVGIGFLNSVLIARYFGAELKGVTATILNYSNIFSIIILFGLNEAYPFFKKECDDENFLNKYMSNVLFVYLIYTLIAFIILLFLKFEISIVVLITITIFQGYSVVVNYVALVEHPNRRNSAITMINIIDIILLILLYSFVPVNFIIASCISTFVYFAESLYFTFDVSFKFNLNLVSLKFLKKIYCFGFFPMIALLLTTLNYRIDILMLGKYSYISYSAIGIYSIGVSLAEKVFLIPNAIKEILLSKLSNGKDENEVIRVIKICWPICLVFTIGLIVFGKPFINLFYGSEYADSYLIVVTSVLGTIFMMFFKMISTYYIVQGKQKQTTVLLSISVLINIIVNALLIPIIGTLGAAIASDISYFICACLFIISFSKYSNTRIKDIIFFNKNDIKKINNIFKNK